MPQAHLSPADLAGKRRREGAPVRIVTNLDGDERTYRLAERAASPGARERIYELAEREALQSIHWGHPAGVGPDDLDLAAAEDAKRIQRRLAAYRDGLGCCESSANLPDDDREVLGLPLSDYGTLAGPAEGHTLREPRAAVTWRRGIVGLIVLGLATALVYGLVRVWLP